jgi:hypothetical protein
MDQPEITTPGRTVIGGRHGSPSVTIALPFSRISGGDEELRGAVADLARLVAQLAGTPSTGDAERALVRQAAEELVTRVTAGR